MSEDRFVKVPFFTVFTLELKQNTPAAHLHHQFQANRDNRFGLKRKMWVICGVKPEWKGKERTLLVTGSVLWGRFLLDAAVP